MKFVRFILFYLIGMIGIVCISVFPQYFSNLQTENAQGYWNQLGAFIKSLANADTWYYTVQDSPGKFPLFQVLYEPYMYSMKIIIGAFVLGLVLAVLLSVMTMYLSKYALHPLQRILDFIESVPDIVIATLLQMLSIFLYKAYGIDLFDVAGYTDPIYFAPIVTLAVLPMVSMYKVIIHLLDEELLKNYIVLVKGKGIGKLQILAKHVFRNMMPAFSQRLKLIVWGMLSSEFVIERIFNVHGFTYYLVDGFTPMIITATLFLIFTPFYILFQLLDNWFDPEKYHPQNSGERHVRGPFRLQTAFEQWKIMMRNLMDTLRTFRPSKSGISRGFKHAAVSLIDYFKNWKVMTGSLFFIIFIGYSVIYSIATDSHVEQMLYRYLANGKLDVAPYPPTDPFLLGSDKFGYSILDQIVVGAKYTLLFGLLIAFLRVFGGLLFGVLYAFCLRIHVQKWIEKLVESFHYVPLSVIAYILLSPILFSGYRGFTNTLQERIMWEVLILTILVVPLTTVLIGKDIRHILSEEFILSARTLGGGKLHLFFRHVLPHIGPKMAILFGQQFIQVLVIFIHLGVYNLYFGGSIGSITEESATSVTFEWSGLIGTTSRFAVRFGYYWYLWVFVAFILAIFAMQLIIQGVTDVQQKKIGIATKRIKSRGNKSANVGDQLDLSQVGKDHFKIIHH